MIKKILVIGIIILFLGTFITPSVAIINLNKSYNPISSGNTLYVGGTGEGNYTRIQDAIDDASDGDTVFVYNGTYYYVVIKKTINLIGEGRENTIIDGRYDHHVVLVSNVNSLKIEGFTITNGSMGIFLSSSCMISIKNNDINSNHGWGVFLTDKSCNNDIINNRIINNSGGVYIVKYSSHNMIINNILQDNTDGRFGFGLGFTGGCSYNYIMYNVISNNYMGIRFAHSRKNTIIKNTIKNHNITDGIYGPSIGIAMNSFCHYNKFEKNNFIDNIEHISSITSRGNSFISNYWDDWIGLKHNWTLIQRFPKVITRYFTYDKIFPIFVFDWHPAKQPYDI